LSWKLIAEVNSNFVIARSRRQRGNLINEIWQMAGSWGLVLALSSLLISLKAGSWELSADFPISNGA